MIGPRVDLRAHEMHGTAAEPHTRRERLTVRVKTGNAGSSEDEY